MRIGGLFGGDEETPPTRARACGVEWGGVGTVLVRGRLTVNH